MEDDVDRQGEMRKLIRLAVVRILIHTRYELIPGAKEKSTMECQDRGEGICTQSTATEPETTRKGNDMMSASERTKATIKRTKETNVHVESP